MTNEVEIAPQGYAPARADLRNPATDSWTDVIEDVAYLAQRIARTEFVPKDLRGSVEKTAAAMLTGRELGLPPMQALSSVYVVHGSPGLYAEAMRGLILQAGHELTFPEMTAARCVIKGRRRDSDEWTSVAYTMADAERAGDVRTNSNYRTRPAEMLLARATTRLARMIFADVIHGLRSVEELEDLAGDGEVTTAVGAVGSSARVSRQARRGAAVDTAQQGASSVGTDGGAPAGERPARRRPALPGRRRAEPTDQEAEPAQDAPQETPQDATTDEQPTDGPDQPGDAQEPQDAAQQARERLKAKTASDPEKITGQQRAAMMAQFSRLEVKDRDVRLGYLSELVGRELASGNDLTRDEASQVLDVLGKVRDVGALQAAVAAYADERGESDAE